jgi:hypothetical protein
MPLRLYFRDVVSDLGGAGQRWLSTRTGRASVNAVTTTTASGTLIPVTATAGGQTLTWFTGRLIAAPSFSWSIPNVATVNLRGLESANSVNAAFGITIEATDASGTVLSTALNNANVPTTLTELATSDGVKSQTNITTAVADVPENGRIKITINIKNMTAQTMGAGTATFSYNSPATAAVAGNSFIIFNDDAVRFEEPMDVQAYEIYGSNGYRG